MLAVLLAMLVVGCSSSTTRPVAGSRDYLIGWYKRAGSESLIPVFKQDGGYFSVCHGFEIPFKECPEGLEWAAAPSSMRGTKIGRDAAGRTYLAVMDSQASNFTDGRYGTGEKETLEQTAGPTGLPDAKARRPRRLDDFVGRYEVMWTPGWEIEIQREGSRFFSTMRARHRTGDRDTHIERHELTTLPDQLGFIGFDQNRHHRLIYNPALKRVELTRTDPESDPSVIRMPLARVSTDKSATTPPELGIGIPSWR